MLLVSYLNQVSNRGEPLRADHEAYLESMIRRSDNDAATAIYAHVGDKGLSELAAQAEMANFRVSRKLGKRADHCCRSSSLLHRPRRAYCTRVPGYVLALLTSISQAQSWGIPEVARPEWQTFFKGGWLTHEDGSLVHRSLA